MEKIELLASPGTFWILQSLAS